MREPGAASSPMFPPALAPGSDFGARLQPFRDMVSSYLRDVVPDREPKRYLYDLIGDHLSRSGKGLRPALCIATCRAFGGNADDVLPLAAALEMLHNAFLVHDDIEDGSKFRRDRPTMHEAHGVPLAINVGDAMQALSIRLARQGTSRVSPDVAWRLLEEFDSMLIESLEGQALELGWVRDNKSTIGEDDYLVMTLKKTCWYSFIHPCRMGALVASSGDLDLERFNKFGYFLGVAFQIQDDVLNLVGEEKKYGKEIGGDLWEGKRTLILVDLFSKMDKFEAERLRAILAKPRSSRLAREVEWIQDRIRRYGSTDAAVATARQFAEASAREFDVGFGDAPESDDKAFIRDLVQYVVTRDL